MFTIIILAEPCALLKLKDFFCEPLQIEEQAMSELLSFYGASDNVHQYITVERVPSTNAQPLWAATQRQSSRLI